MVTELEEGVVGRRRNAILTAPFSLEGETDVGDGYGAPNLFHRILSLLKSVRPGSDLTRFHVPPMFNVPKSQLQCYGESVYCIGGEMLRECVHGEDSVERMKGVVGWSISTTRPVLFGVAPYNPILGETHHVSRGSLNLLLEQVSHDPPVSALHATDETHNVETIWYHYPLPKFYGASVEAEVHGKRQLNLMDKGESYVMNSPKLVIRFFPVPSVDWIGNVTIRCEQTGLEAELCYHGTGFLGRKSNRRAVKGRIFMSSPSSSNTILEVDGHWDRIVTAKDIRNGEVTVIYNAKEMLSELKTPIVKDPKGVWESESAVVWSEVSDGIMKKDWEKARKAKQAIEENERENAKQRKCEGGEWIPKHFTVSNSKENGWECLPIQKWVPPAPIVVPL